MVHLAGTRGMFGDEEWSASLELTLETERGSCSIEAVTSGLHGSTQTDKRASIASLS